MGTSEIMTSFNKDNRSQCVPVKLLTCDYTTILAIREKRRKKKERKAGQKTTKKKHLMYIGANVDHSGPSAMIPNYNYC